VAWAAIAARTEGSRDSCRTVVRTWYPRRNSSMITQLPRFPQGRHAPDQDDPDLPDR